jgi:lipid A 4'-phosphatase
MNRTGLIIALSLALVIGIVFGIHPEFDLHLAALFYDPATKTFPLKASGLASFARDASMWIAWAFALPAIVALVVKMFRPDRPIFMSGRAVAFLLITLLLAAGILTNLTFKSHWARPRPVMVKEFSGPWKFMAWWDPRGECGRNCSFFSGEGATAFWTLAPAALTPPALRPVAYAGAVVFGALTSVLRMAFGGHFFTDVSIAGLVTFLVIWLVHGDIYRWPSTRKSDAEIDAALTRFAWPGYRFRQRLLGRDVGPAPLV